MGIPYYFRKIVNDFPDMHEASSLKSCEAWHHEVACTDSVVLAGGRSGITMLERCVDGRRLLFPGQPWTLWHSHPMVPSLHLHAIKMFLLLMCGYKIIYRLQVPQGIEICSFNGVC